MFSTSSGWGFCQIILQQRRVQTVPAFGSANPIPRIRSSSATNVLSYSRKGHYHCYPVSQCYALRRSRVRSTVYACERKFEAPIPSELEQQVREYISSLPEQDQDGSPLSYEALHAAGRDDLIQSIADNGGYAFVSRRLGVPIGDMFMDNLKRDQELQSQFRFNKVDDESGALTLGAGREARIEEGMREATELHEVVAASKEVEDKVILLQGDNVPSAAELSLIGKDLVETRDEIIPPGERFTLDLRMRVGTLALVVSASLGWGEASPEIFSANVIEAMRLISLSLLIVHFALVPYVFFVLAPRTGRNALLWSCKVLLSGPLGVISLLQHEIAIEDEN